MIYETLRFGEIEVKDQQIITFPLGLPGFPAQKKYIPIEYQKDGSLAFLQSLELPELAFIIADPFKYVANYEVNIPAGDLEGLGITKPEEAVVYVILTVSQGGENITANLVAPLVINRLQQKGKQVILSNCTYSTQYPLTAGQAARK